MRISDHLRRRGAFRNASRVSTTDGFALFGGLNQVDEYLGLKPGELIDVLNYEPIYTGGYAVTEGFERYDGNISPTDAEYVYCTLNKEEEDGQLLTAPRDATDAAWISIGTPLKATVTGYDGVADAGFSLQDNDNAGHEGIYQEYTTPAEKGVYLLQCMVEKESSASWYPHVTLGDPGDADKRVHFGIDTVNGKLYPAVEGGSSYAFKDMGQAYHVIDYNDDYWLFAFPWVNDGTTTTLRASLYPAFDSTANHGATGTTSVIGITNFDLVTMYRKVTDAYYQPGDVRAHERIVDPRNLAGENWVPAEKPAIVERTNGYDGNPRGASKLIAPGGYSSVALTEQLNTEKDGEDLWQVSFLVNKTSGTPGHYPAVSSFGSSSNIIYIDTTNGALSEDSMHTLDLPSGISSYNDDFWLIWFAVYPSGAGSLVLTVYPAATSAWPGTTLVSATTGSTTFDLFSLHPHPLVPNVPPQSVHYPAQDVPVLAMSLTDQLIDTQAIEGRDLSDSAWTKSNASVSDGLTFSGPFDALSKIGFDEISAVNDSAGGAAGYVTKAISGFSTPDDDDVMILSLFIQKAENPSQGEEKCGLYLGDGSYGAEVMFDRYKGEFIDIADSDRKPLETGVYNWSHLSLQVLFDAYWLVWIKFTGNGSSTVNVRLYPSYASAFSASGGASDDAAQAEVNMAWPMVSWNKDSPHAGIAYSMDTSGARDIITLTNKVGTWHKDEILWAYGYPIGQLNDDPLETAPTTALDAAAKAAAQAYARKAIQSVPGSGQIRGIVQMDGLAYAFRDDSSGANVDVYKAVPNAGWGKLTLNEKVRFDAGTSEITVGMEYPLVGGTSGAEAYVKRVVVTSGDWSTNDAVGYVLIGPRKGGTSFQNNEQLTQNSVNVATADGAEEAQTFPVGGRYDFRIYNFGGHAGTKRIYGVNGVSRAFDLDVGDDSLCQIETGMTTDTPNHIGFFKQRLVLTFSGGSVQQSSVAAPLVWSVVTGASEIGVGEEVADLIEEVGKALIILGRNQTFALYDEGSLVLDLVNRESGCIPFCAQRLGQAMYLDDRGITTTPAVDAYGNFKSSTVSRKFNPTIDALRGTAISSHISRSKNLYRVSFSDGTNLSVGFDGRKLVGATKTDYGFPLRVVHSYEDASGAERIFAGSDDGFIYELDKGTSFDGANKDCFIELAYHYSGRPSSKKTYRGARVDLVSRGDMTVDIEARFDNGQKTTKLPSEQIAITGSSESRRSIMAKFKETAENISLKFSHSANDEPVHELHSVTYHTSLRHRNRGQQLT